ncbi:MAG: peptidase E, partial [Actinomycetia bacterium]|nr:peptidase E [Actinomycetes bacterium]
MSEVTRSIVLLGGGFSEPEHGDLDEFVIESSGVARPRICFLPTASGDSADYIGRFYAGLGRFGCRLSHLELFRRSVTDIDGYVRQHDVIYVGGGNTANLLAVWRRHGVDEALRRAYADGVTLAGISAGAACWFEACLTDSFGRLDPLRDGLGLLRGSFCPHYDSEPDRPARFTDLVRIGGLPAGLGLDDGAAVWLRNESVRTVRSVKQGAGVHRVTPLGDMVGQVTGP